MNLKQKISTFSKTKRRCLMWVISWVESIVWIVKNKPIPYPHRYKTKIISDYAIKFKVQTLIETGTYLGQTIDDLESEFDSIYSVELDKKLYLNAKKMFFANKKIKIFQGDSSKILPKIISKIKKTSLFWLDAHYSKGITAKGDIETPILKELFAISKSKIKNHLILIDDARKFTGKDDYPTIKMVKNLVKNYFFGYKIIVKEDIIRIYPHE